MPSRTWRHTLALAVVLCLPSLAQEFRGGISGIVRDSQGAAMPKVSVDARNIATNETLHTATNASGSYSFPLIPLGTYRVTASLPGFKQAVRDQLEIRVGDNVQQDFMLEVGGVTESITVT